MKVPQHVAFIMDGNRRWARKNQLRIIMGHNKGVDRVEELVEYASELGIDYMTFWAFSTENWNRAKEEVDDLMTVFRNLVNGPMIKRMMEKGIRVQTIGDISAFPQDIFTRLEEIKKQSSENTKVTVVFGLNYGGRFEILRAIGEILRKKIKNVDEKTFADYLFTAGMPDPDMIVRTGGEQRLSGFLPWQTVYAELYFTDTLWPDFDVKEFQKALDEYSARERRFGK